MTESAPISPDVPDVPVKRPTTVGIYVGVPTANARTSDPIAELSDTVRPLGFVGTAIEGDVLGAPGWVIACTIGFGDGRMFRWIRGQNGSELRPDLTWDGVRTTVAATFGPGVQVGRYVVVEDGVFPGGQNWAPRVSGLEPRELVIGPIPRIDGPLLGNAAKAPVRAVFLDPVMLVEAADPALSADLEAVATSPGKGVTYLLWRNGPWAGFLAARRGRAVAAHTWGPEWRAIDPSGGGPELDGAVVEVLSSVRMPRVRGEAFADLLGFDGIKRIDLIRLVDEELPTTPIPRLLAALGLPAVAGDVLEGRTALADMPDAHVYEKKGLLRAIVEKGPEDDAAVAVARERREEAAAAASSSAEPVPGMLPVTSGRRWWEWPENWVRSRLRKVLIAPVFALAAWYFFSVGATARGWTAVGTGVLALGWSLLSPEARSKPADGDVVR